MAVHFCAPSVTPWRYKVPGLGTGPAHNPSIRLLKYNKTSGNLLDFTQYYMDLPEVNRNNASEWLIEYNATKVYSLPDLSPSSFAELITRMKSQQSSEFQSFHRFWTVSVGDQYQKSCNDECHARFYCNFKHVYHDKYQQCYKDFSVSAASRGNVRHALILWIICTSSLLSV